MAFAIDWCDDGLYVRWTGLTDHAEVMLFLQELHGHPRFDQMRWVLHDYLACTGMTCEQPEIQLIAALDHAAGFTNPLLRIALVTTRDDVRACARGYVTSGLSAYPMRLFESVASAQGWLGCGDGLAANSASP